jgi:hypothetical protein
MSDYFDEEEIPTLEQALDFRNVEDLKKLAALTGKKSDMVLIQTGERTTLAVIESPPRCPSFSIGTV